MYRNKNVNPFSTMTASACFYLHNEDPTRTWFSWQEAWTPA